MVDIKPKKPSNNILQKTNTIPYTGKESVIPTKTINTKKIMDYEEYEEVEGNEYLVVQGETKAKRVSVDSLFGYDKDVSKIIIGETEYSPSEGGAIDLSEIVGNLSDKEHEHDNYALVNHTHANYLTIQSLDDIVATKEELKLKSPINHEHIEYAFVDHKHDEYLTEHQSLDHLATKNDLKASEARLESLLDTHEHEEYAFVDHKHDEYLTSESIEHLATKDDLRACDARFEDLVETHEHEQYSPINHKHEGVYSDIDHNHINEYSAILHEHSNYAPIKHEHEEYAPIIHTHEHTHEEYAPVNHTHDDYLTEHQPIFHLVSRSELLNHMDILNAKIKQLQDTIDAMPKLSFDENNNLIVKIGDTVRLFKGLGPEDEDIFVENEMIIDNSIATYVEEDKELTIENAVLDEETGNLTF